MRHITLNPSYTHLRPFVKDIDHLFATRGETIYKARNEIKVITAPSGEELNVKRYAIPHLINKVAYVTLRSPKGRRAYNNALRLHALGITTPPPVAYIEQRRYGLMDISYLITLQMPFPRDMYEFGHSDLEGRDRIVHDFALFSAEMHKKGVLHRDYSPGNILFDGNDADGYRFCLVDINRMSFGPISFETRCASFARLWGRDDFIRLLASTYAEAMGDDPTETYRLIRKYHDHFWAKRERPF